MLITNLLVSLIAVYGHGAWARNNVQHSTVKYTPWAVQFSDKYEVSDGLNIMFLLRLC